METYALISEGETLAGLVMGGKQNYRPTFAKNSLKIYRGRVLGRSAAGRSFPASRGPVFKASGGGIGDLGKALDQNVTRRANCMTRLSRAALGAPK